MAKQQLKFSVLLQNFIAVVTDCLGWDNFFDVFGSICPVLQTRISWKRFLSETSSRAKEFGKSENVSLMINSVQNCFIQAKRLKYLFRIFFLRIENKLAFYFQLFCTKWCSNYFWREIIREAILNFLPRKLPGETLCKLYQIFPPKVLVYRGNIFSSHLFY